jgi:uncharacterized membrane protein YuzA (DUF378 family)
LTKYKKKGDFMETAQKSFLIITIVGAINWGLIGLFDLNFVATIFGAGTLFEKIIYILVGVAGLFNIGILFNHIKPE